MTVARYELAADARHLERMTLTPSHVTRVATRVTSTASTHTGARATARPACDPAGTAMRDA